MKKTIAIIILFGSIFSADAQFLNYGLKGGLNYNSNGDLENDVRSVSIESDTDTGFHFGVFAEFDLPLSLYLRPELLYTKTQSDYNYEGFNSVLSINKIDAPILLGLEVFNFGRIFIGPSFQYILNTDLSNSGFFDEIKEIRSKNFSLGAQFGIGVEFGKLGADLRWERSITDTETDYIGRLISQDLNEEVHVDTRSQQFILSVYYKFQ